MCTKRVDFRRASPAWPRPRRAAADPVTKPRIGFSSVGPCRSVVAVTAGILAIAVLCSAADGTPGDSQQAMSSRVLLAIVAAGNRALVDLGPDDFVIEEGGATRDVFEMHVADYPLVVLIDNSAAARSDLEAIRDAAARFVSRVGERAVAVGPLAAPPSILASFDDERAKVLAEIRAVSVDPSAGLMPLEAIARAVTAIETAGTAFSAIV